MNNVVMMGADFYESEESRAFFKRRKLPHIGIGEGTTIENAIIDKNARIGKNVKVTNKDGVQEYECPQYTIRDGIVVIPKASIILDGTEI